MREPTCLKQGPGTTTCVCSDRQWAEHGSRLRYAPPERGRVWVTAETDIRLAHQLPWKPEAGAGASTQAVTDEAL